MFNTNGGARSVRTDSPSPLLARTVFPISNSVEPRRIPTRAAAPIRNNFDDADSGRITIQIATLNIRDARNSNLEAALRALGQMNVDVAVLTETRLNNDRYTRSAFDYIVSATTTTHMNQGGIALAHRTSNRWQVESEMRHGPNVISFLLISGQRRFFMIGVYIPPNDTLTLTQIQEARDRYANMPVIMMGDLNVDLNDPNPDDRTIEIMGLLSSFGLEDMASHFRQRAGFRHGDTWHMVREGELISSKCDYILAPDRRIFQFIRIKEPRYNSDHLMVTGGILSATRRENFAYLRGRKQFPLQKTEEMSDADKLHQELKDSIDMNDTYVTRRKREPWISETTWKLIDKRASQRNNQKITSAEKRQLRQRIRRALNRDRKQRTKQAGETIESNLQAGNLTGAWNTLQAWYRHTGNRPPKPARQDFRKVERTYGKLYQRSTSPGEPIPVHVTPFNCNDSVPEEAEIAAAVRKLKSGKTPGQSGIRAEHLKQMLASATKEKCTPEDRKGWELVCRLVQHMFETGEIPQELSWSIMVLIPKANGDMRGIGLLEIIWKTCSSIINSRLQDSIQFHEALHGFRKQRGTGTAILETKLLMQRAQIQGKPLYMVFLDLSKAYDTLDRERTLEILEKYGVGARVQQLIQNFWESLLVVGRQQGYHSKPIKSERGTTQGDVASPTIFNIVVDAIVRDWYHTNSTRADNSLGHDQEQNNPAAIFYADDGNLYSLCAATLQQATDHIVELFSRIGLQTNPDKTKVMVCVPGQLVTRICSPAYKRMRGDEVGESYNDRKRRRVQCDICEKPIQARNLARHRRNQHGIAIPISDNGTPPHLANLGTEYTICIATSGDTGQCPVPTCNVTVTSRFGMRRHFQHRHPQDTIIIEGEGRFPRCESCGMFVNPISLGNGSHQRSKLCRKGKQRRENEQRNLICMRATRQTFHLQDRQIEMVQNFRYLGRLVTTNDDDWAAMTWNLGKARQRWSMTSRVLSREGASPRISAMFYKAIIQTVLLYGSETWVISGDIMNALRSFHHSVARRLTGRYPYQHPDSGDWIYPSITHTLAQAGMFTIEEYLRRRFLYLGQHAKTSLILQDCLTSLLAYRTTRRLFWWNQESLNYIEVNDLTRETEASGGGGT